MLQSDSTTLPALTLIEYITKIHLKYIYRSTCMQLSNKCFMKNQTPIFSSHIDQSLPLEITKDLILSKSFFHTTWFMWLKWYSNTLDSLTHGLAFKSIIYGMTFCHIISFQDGLTKWWIMICHFVKFMNPKKLNQWVQVRFSKSIF